MESDHPKQIKLDQFLKWVGVTATGGQAKMIIQAGEVRVNGERVTQRGRQLKTGDRVTVGGQSFTVELPDPAP
ncbi:RNA-binding S4 domain-containing protein [Trichothermofontia sp.]